MAKIGGRAEMKATITLHLSEGEAAALDAIAGYSAADFLTFFYAKFGEAYLKPYEKDLILLFDSVRNGDAGVQLFLRRAKEARAVFDGRMIARDLP